MKNLAIFIALAASIPAARALEKATGIIPQLWMIDVQANALPIDSASRRPGRGTSTVTMLLGNPWEAAAPLVPLHVWSLALSLRMKHPERGRSYFHRGREAYSAHMADDGSTLMAIKLGGRLYQTAEDWPDYD